MLKRLGLAVFCVALLSIVRLARGQTTPLTGEYVATPSAWVWSTCIYNIPNNSGFNVDSGVVMRMDGGYDGGYLFKVSPCPHPAIPFGDGGGTTGGTGGTGGTGTGGGGTTGGMAMPDYDCTTLDCYDGWVESVQYHAPTGSVICQVEGTSPVPDIPSTISGNDEEVIWFNGIEKPLSLSSNSILQPVLMIGQGPNGGYNDGWQILAYFLTDDGTQFYYGSADGAVSPGDTIFSNITLNWEVINGNWQLVYQAFIEDQTSGAWDALDFWGFGPDNDQYKVADLQVLEAHSFAYCSQLPSHSEGLTYSSVGVNTQTYASLAWPGGTCADGPETTGWSPIQAWNEINGRGDLPACNWWADYAIFCPIGGCGPETYPYIQLWAW